MPTPTLHYTRSTPSSPLQKAAGRFDIDLTDPLRHNPAAVPSSHPSSPVANPPLFSDPKVAQALLVDYVAGLTASRLCANYNISLPQLFAWRRSPETQAMLAEHEEFAAAQTRQVQHDKEPEIILTLCAIATRGSSESESRRAASDLLRAFKFRDYLAQRANPRPRNLASQSDTQPSGTSSDSSVPSDSSDLSNPRSATPRPPRPYTPSPPFPRFQRATEHSADRSNSTSRSSPSQDECTSAPTPAAAPNASQPERLPESSRGSPRPAAHSRCTLAQPPHAECVQPTRPAIGSRGETAHNLASEHTSSRSLSEAIDAKGVLEDASTSQPPPNSPRICPGPPLLPKGEVSSRRLGGAIDAKGVSELPAAESPSRHFQTLAADTDPDDEEPIENELEADNEEDELETADVDELDESDETACGEYNDEEDDDEGEDEGEDENSPKSAIPNPKSEMPSHSALPDARCLIPDASPFEQEILTLPAEVRAYSRPAPDPAPGFPFCLIPKPSGSAPSFEEMTRFMPPPSKSFNPFWPESDILYLCYPGRTDKHNLRSAIVSHQEMLARSGAQALVDRNHFPPDQQSHQAYCAAEDFYKQLARKTPPPDH